MEVVVEVSDERKGGRGREGKEIRMVSGLGRKQFYEALEAIRFLFLSFLLG